MIFFLTVLSFISLSLSQFAPNWNSLDGRKLPSWYDEGKIGIIMHYGVYSVPSWGDPKTSQASGEWFWDLWKSNQGGYQKFMDDNYQAWVPLPGFRPPSHSWVVRRQRMGGDYRGFRRQILRHHQQAPWGLLQLGFQPVLELELNDSRST